MRQSERSFTGSYEKQLCGCGSGKYAGVGPKSYQRPDYRIQEEICRRIEEDPEIDGSDLEVDVKGGEVVVTGTVNDRRAKHCLEDIVDDVTGVKEVTNRIRIKERSSEEYGSDESESIAAYGIYPSRESAEYALNVLRHEGFRREDISILFPDEESPHGFGHEQATKLPEGLAAGAVGGAALGGVLGWLVGLGAFLIPGAGPLIAAGPIAGMLAGMGAGGALGGLTGALIGMGIPEYEAKRYEGRILAGGVLLSVHCNTDQERDHVEHVLRETGAEDVSSKGEASSPDLGRESGEHANRYY